MIFLFCVGCHMSYQTTPLAETLTTLVTWMTFYSSVWVIKCIIRLPLWLKLLPQWLHEWFFTPVWVFMCVIRWLLLLKCLPHWLHEWFFTFFTLVLDFMCFQITHLVETLTTLITWMSFTPVWVVICVIRLLSCLKFLPHWLHE